MPDYMHLDGHIKIVVRNNRDHLSRSTSASRSTIGDGTNNRSRNILHVVGTIKTITSGQGNKKRGNIQYACRMKVKNIYREGETCFIVR